MELGIYDVEGMLSDLSTQGFLEWMDYVRYNPFGEQRADWRSAMLACTMANMWRGKHSRRYKVEDFMPKFKRPVRRMSADEMKRVLFNIPRFKKIN